MVRTHADNVVISPVRGLLTHRGRLSPGRSSPGKKRKPLRNNNTVKAIKRPNQKDPEDIIFLTYDEASDEFKKPCNRMKNHRNCLLSNFANKVTGTHCNFYLNHLILG